MTERGRARETEIEREEKIGEDEIGVWDQRRCVCCIIPLQLLVEAKNESSFYDDGLQESHFPL